jgi:type VI secretion system protein ImpA
MRLMNNNFLELLKELAPDALAEVAKIMGVSPESVGGDTSGSSTDSTDSSW